MSASTRRLALRVLPLLAAGATLVGSVSATAATRAKPTTATKTTATATKSVSTTSGVGRSGTQLLLNGSPHHFTGFNAPELATDFSFNHGCGDSVTSSDLATLFSSLPTGSLVRFDAYQQLAVDSRTGALNWSAIDKVVSYAQTYHQYLIFVLSSQSGTCDNDLWHGPTWYSTGYKQTYSDGGRNIEPYWTWVQQVVQRYRGSSAVGMWEPVSEPAVTDIGAPCLSNAASILSSFFTSVGGWIHSADPKHLVSAGFTGTWQCGTVGSDYATVGASSGVDVLTYHDYGNDATPVPAELSPLLSASLADRKPLVTEEAGITAGSSGCAWTPAQRSSLMQTTITQQVAAGTAGYLVWDWVPVPTAGCSYDVAPGDPVLSMLSTLRV